MSDQGEQYDKSWVLYHILDGFIGSRETVAVRRKLIVAIDQLENSMMTEIFTTGSRAEGMHFEGSDADLMCTVKHVIVMCPHKDVSYQIDSETNTVLMMRDTNCRPGYANLELVQLGKGYDSLLEPAIVQKRGVYFISSEIFRRTFTDLFSEELQTNMEMHGPAATLQDEHSVDLDRVVSFQFYYWPSEANEWLSRPRLSGWPDKTLRDQIVQGGCHLVPVGDKTSADQFVQWRISFTTAERKLIHSLTHVQFVVYGLLKYFLKQISGMVKQILGEQDIISSYIIKTVIFHAVESTPGSFWQEKQTFLCFMLCLKILVNWVKVGHCPNYFIKNNNMFLGKVYGENQRKLLRVLTDLYDMKWGCLSVGTYIQPTIGELMQSVRKGTKGYVLPPQKISEYECDVNIFCKLFSFRENEDSLPVSLKLLSASRSDIDEFIGYFATVQALSYTGMKTFGEHVTARGNKEKYKSLRKSKNLLRPFATVCTSPGLLSFATYYYQTGNYMKSLEICDKMISSSTIYLDNISSCNYSDRYEQLFSGRGYNLLHRCQAFVSDITFVREATQFCPPELHPEITKRFIGNALKIPPLPYAVFLSFLCYHELGDIRKRDTALIHLRAVKYDKDQGGGEYWIVHNLLGICYETVRDTRRALREYRDSLGVDGVGGCTQYKNPAKERITHLQH
ncbi:uncharacterized protein LOC110458748 [Mizuhopecten yessoensis]|uniref:uncharacterized protein LOC110458748 n=1 Tax=Mizuhopecten yessoensis TaxID=6573 RepID=UPI000B45D280|nr:uncharacterized protein LOC110458748 [Mizuhopecten yessoensis]